MLTIWDRRNLPALLTLSSSAPGHWENAFGDANLNGRSYGGQLLGQAMMAATRDVSLAERRPTMMQFMFLQGALPNEPIDFAVTRLQDGKRFSSRHVRGTQAGQRIVLDAQVSCAAAIAGPIHQQSTERSHFDVDPALLPGPDDIPAGVAAAIEKLGGYTIHRNPVVDFRIPDMATQFGPVLAPRFRFWIKANAVIADNDTGMHAAAFAYLSDWWLSFSALGLHRSSSDPRRLYTSSLNHAMWLHRPPVANDWLHVDSFSHGAGDGRGLSMASIHDRQGRLVASTTQEVLMAYADR